MKPGARSTPSRTLAAGLLVTLLGCASGIGVDDFIVPTFHSYFAVAAADLDGRGQVQVAATDFLSGTGNHSHSVALLAGAGGGVPRLADRLTLTQSPNAVVYGDLDGDGLQDLVVLTAEYNEPSHLQIYLQDPARPGSFLTPQVVALPAGGGSLCLADLDGDGRLELLTWAGGTWSLHQDPVRRGTFLAPVALPGIPQGFLVAADLNGDGRTDLAVAAADQTLRIFLQDPASGTLVAGPVHNLAGVPLAFCAGDLNGDGRPDLALALRTTVSPSAGSIVVYAQAPGSAGSFQAVATGLTFTGGLGFSGLVFADLDGDGRGDLAYTQVGPGVLSISLQQAGSPGVFGPRTDRGGFSVPGALPAADLDGDGRQDLLVASSSLDLLRQDPARSGTFLAPVRLLP